jgi:hypothetical protein
MALVFITRLNSMTLSTYLVNDTRKEYVATSDIINILPKMVQWDLRKDHIYVWHTDNSNVKRYRSVSEHHPAAAAVDSKDVVGLRPDINKISRNSICSGGARERL